MVILGSEIGFMAKKYIFTSKNVFNRTPSWSSRAFWGKVGALGAQAKDPSMRHTMYNAGFL